MPNSITSNASGPLPAEPAAGQKAQVTFLAAAVLALLAALALLIDLPVARWLSEHRVPGDWRRLVRLAEVFGWGGSVALLILLAAALDTRGWRVALRLAASAFGAGLLADAIKLLVARWRPSAAPPDATTALATFVAWLPVFNPAALPARYGFSLQSFPSAHAATAVGLGLGLAAIYPRGRWLFWLFAALACFQRIEAQAHFVSDVLAGAAVACIVFGLLQWTALRH